MSIVLESFKIRNTDRGKAKLLATFDVNLGPLTIRGMELVEWQGSSFVGVPNNRYKGADNTYKKFNYVAFNDERGKELNAKIHQMASEAYSQSTPVSSPPPVASPSITGIDDDLPF